MNVIVFTVKGPPTIQKFNPIHYLVAGDQFTLSCTANDDRDSPIGTQFVWYKDGNDITGLTELMVANKSVYTSQLSLQLNSDDHSGNYSCIAYNNPSANVTTSTTLVVES